MRGRGEKSPLWIVGREASSWTVGRDDAEVVGEGEGVPEGAFIAGGGVAVEIEDWWGSAGWIAVFTPSHGAAIREAECLCLGRHDEAFDNIRVQPEHLILLDKKLFLNDGKL
jgi:hypothetical protein